MVLVDDAYHDKLFVNHVDDLRQCGTTAPRTGFLRLRMAHTLRLLVTEGDGNSLAARVQQRYSTPLLVVMHEAESGNIPRDKLLPVPKNVMGYVEPITKDSHPPGTYHKPYTLSDYLDRTAGVFFRPIKPRELIKFFANKMGGSHADDELLDLGKGGRSVDAETLHFLNKKGHSFRRRCHRLPV